MHCVLWHLSRYCFEPYRVIFRQFQKTIHRGIVFRGILRYHKNWSNMDSTVWTRYTYIVIVCPKYLGSINSPPESLWNMPLITLKALVVSQKLYPSLPKRSTIRQLSLRSRVIAQKIPFLRNEIPFFPNVSIRSEINKIEVINHVNMPLITLEALVSSRRWCRRRIPSQLCKLFRNKIPGFPGADPRLPRKKSLASQKKKPH